MGTKICGLESKIDTMAEQLKADIRLEIKRDMKELYEKWRNRIEQMVSLVKENQVGKVVATGIYLDSPRGQQNSTGDFSDSGEHLKAGYSPVIQEPDSLKTTLKTL